MREPGYLRDHENKIIVNKHGHQLLDDGWDYVVDDYGNIFTDEYGIKCMTPESRAGLGMMWRDAQEARAVKEGKVKTHHPNSVTCSHCDCYRGFEPEDEGFQELYLSPKNAKKLLRSGE